MWPYHPWLFKVQNPAAQQQDTGEDDAPPQARIPSQNQSQVGTPAHTRAPSYLPTPAQTSTASRSPSQTRSRRLQPRPAARDWGRRYQPSINSRVYGYPSSGGVLVLPGYDIDLPLIGLSRFNEARRSGNQVEEDTFCRRLRYLGAVWWPYPDADLDALNGSGNAQDAERAAMHVAVGYLANGGGVWVLKYSENDPDDNDLSLRAQRVGPLNMHDRCRLIEELGGTYYRHPEECEDLRWGNWPTQH